MLPGFILDELKRRKEERRGLGQPRAYIYDIHAPEYVPKHPKDSGNYEDSERGVERGVYEVQITKPLDDL